MSACVSQADAKVPYAVRFLLVLVCKISLAALNLLPLKERIIIL